MDSFLELFAIPKNLRIFTEFLLSYPLISNERDAFDRENMKHISFTPILFAVLFSVLTPNIYAQDSIRAKWSSTDTASVFLTPMRGAKPTPSDSNTPTDTTSIFMQDLIHFIRVGFGIATAPLVFDKSDWRNVGISIAATASLFFIDKTIKQWALANQNKTDDFLFYLDHYYGKGYSLIFTWGLYGYGALMGNERLRKLGRNATEAFVFSGAITGAIKLLVGRRRPYAGDNHLFFHPFQFSNNDFQAMPSGHTTVSFAVSTVMAKSIDNFYWKLFWYGSAALVGASRIYHNQHWLSDVTMGALIGYSVGNYVVHYDRRSQSQALGKGFLPYYAAGKIGLCYGF